MTIEIYRNGEQAVVEVRTGTDLVVYSRLDLEALRHLRAELDEAIESIEGFRKTSRGRG